MKTSVRIISLLLALQAAACLDPVSSNLPPVPEGPPCVPSQSVSGEPITDPEGPISHQIALGQTTDGLAITGSSQVLAGASTPDGVLLFSGTVLIYYLNAADGAIWVGRYTSGVLNGIAPIKVNGISAPAGVTQPDVQLLPSGDVRLTYVGGIGDVSEENPRAICIADSDDGTDFVVRSVAMLQPVDEPLIAHPTMVRLAQRSWLMAFSQGTRVATARSTDGYHFTRDTSFNMTGAPELSFTNGGAVRIYTCTQNGISSFQSPNDGRTFQLERVVISSPFNGKTIVCDPSVIQGSGIFVFRTAG